MSPAEKNREGVNTVTPKKRRPVTLGTRLDARSAFARVPGGKSGTSAATPSARRGHCRCIRCGRLVLIANSTRCSVTQAHIFLGQHRLGYLFSALLAFAVGLTRPLEPVFFLSLSASTAAILVSAFNFSAARRALWVALLWLARRFISFALCLPRIAMLPRLATAIDR